MPGKIDVTSARSWPELQTHLEAGLKAAEAGDSAAESAAVEAAKRLIPSVGAEIASQLSPDDLPKAAQDGLKLRSMEDRLSVLGHELERSSTAARAQARDLAKLTRRERPVSNTPSWADALETEVAGIKAELMSPIGTEYDAFGNPIALTRGSGRVLVLEYDQAGRIVGAVPQ